MHTARRDRESILQTSMGAGYGQPAASGTCAGELLTETARECDGNEKGGALETDEGTKVTRGTVL